MTRILLTLGPGLNAAPHGDIVVLDWDSKSIVDSHRFTHQVYSDSHKGMTGASWWGNNLLVATEAEIVEYQVKPLRVVRSKSFPFFNDLHFVTPVGDQIFVCNTGLDCIDVFDRDWQHQHTIDLITPFGRRPQRIISLMREDFMKSWRRMLRPRNYYSHLTHRPAFRNVVKLASPSSYRRSSRDLRFCDLRPHVLHPNHIMAQGGEIYVTLWSTGELVKLNGSRVVLNGLGHPHDGFISDNQLFVTDCSTNRVIIAKPGMNGSLYAIAQEKTVTSALQEGFLRGLAKIDDRLFVGLTARRGAPAEMRVAQVVELSLPDLEIRDRWQVPKELGTSVFSVLNGAGPNGSH